MLGKIFSRVSVSASNRAMAMRRLSTSLRGRIPSDDGLEGVRKVVSLGVGGFLGYVFTGWYIQMCKKVALEESRYIEMLEKQALEESREVSEQKDIVQKKWTGSRKTQLRGDILIRCLISYYL